MKNWISLPRIEGAASRQAHADLPPGTYERELGKEGFYGPSTQMYHRHPPTAWKSFEGPLRPRAFDTTRLTTPASSPWDAVPLMENPSLRLRFWRSDRPMDQLVRNSDGDELVFVHSGNGELYCDYGHLSVGEGDYVMLPRGTAWRIDTRDTFSALLLEATNESYGLPEKGIVGQHAVFDPAVLEVPQIDEAFRSQQNDTEWRIVIKRRGELSVQTFDFNPLDAIGWHGTLMPVKLNWRSIRPLMSHRAHLPPSAHTTFVSTRFVVCTFCPRPLESDPGALKVPFFHNNDDFDEVIFYHAGEFFSRDNIHPGMITLHPSGFTHGPHPKALRTGTQAVRKETNEVAVMIDSRDALEVAPLPDRVEWTGYVESWKT